MPLIGSAESVPLSENGLTFLRQQRSEWDGVALEVIRCRSDKRGIETCVDLPEHALFAVGGGTDHFCETTLGNTAPRRKPVGRRELRLVPAASRYMGRFVGEMSYMGVFLRPDHLGRIADELGSELPSLSPCIGFDDPLVWSALFALKEEMDTGGARGRLFADSVVTMLATHLIARYGPGAVDGLGAGGRREPEAAWLRRTAEFVEANLGEDISLADLALVSGFSPAHFARMFRRHVGVTPHRYVVERRVERAKRLLAETSISVAEIAFRTGFSSQAHLTTTFGRTVGTAPGAYRQALRA